MFGVVIKVCVLVCFATQLQSLVHLFKAGTRILVQFLCEHTYQNTRKALFMNDLNCSVVILSYLENVLPVKYSGRDQFT